MRQNRMMRLTSTTMLKGFFSTFRIRFFKRRLVRGFLGKPFFDTITPLSEVCRGIAGDSSLLSFLSSVRSLTGGVPSSGRKRLHFLATIIKNS